jgi:hypothetical protein
MRKIITTNAILISSFVLIALGAFSFYSYGKTRQACIKVQECTKSSPAHTEMLWDVLSHQISSSSTR